ncbi:hypothetical protein [Microbacterium sp. NPDC056234]|uniref:hypothetical protein n=1 Tax=Microbacterium sp. NPDC056234 TaxID=3345757 RepID=UPI0035D6F9E5
MTTTSALSPLTMTGDPRGSRPPAPKWLTDKVPGAKALARAFESARNGVAEANVAHRAALDALREASKLNSGVWEPRVDVEYDRWRQLKARKIEAEAAIRHAETKAATAWEALYEHLHATPHAQAEANRVANEHFAAIADAFTALDDSVAAFAEAESLVHTKYNVREGFYTKRFSEQYRQDTAALRKAVSAYTAKEAGR